MIKKEINISKKKKFKEGKKKSKYSENKYFWIIMKKQKRKIILDYIEELISIYFDFNNEIYTCQNDVKSNISSFENINNFYKKKLILENIEDISMISSKGNNLKSKVCKDLGGTESSVKLIIKENSIFINFDN